MTNQSECDACNAGGKKMLTREQFRKLNPDIDKDEYYTSEQFNKVTIKPWTMQQVSDYPFWDGDVFILKYNNKIFSTTAAKYFDHKSPDQIMEFVINILNSTEDIK